MTGEHASGDLGSAWLESHLHALDKLERECRIDVYSDAVPNGRSTVVVTHPSGRRAECSEHTSQYQNRIGALERLAANWWSRLSDRAPKEAEQ